MSEAERPMAVFNVFERAIRSAKTPLPVDVAVDVAFCYLSRVDAFVVAYAKACSATAQAASPVDAAYQVALAGCKPSGLAAIPTPRPPLRKESAPPLSCPPGATTYTGGEGFAEACARPDETLDGPAREWFASGFQRHADTWTNGKKTGVWFTWAEDGTCESARTYRDGQLEGPEVFWFPNGRMRTLTSYRGDKRNGAVGEWSEAGQMIVLGGFTNDKKNGVWYFRKPGSEETARVFFEHGREVSVGAGIFPLR